LILRSFDKPAAAVGRRATPRHLQQVQQIIFKGEMMGTKSIFFLSGIVAVGLGLMGANPVDAQFIENQPGAGGRTGAKAAAQATPDGYTLQLAGTNPNAIAQSLFRLLSFEPIKDYGLTRSRPRAPGSAQS
jgi:Tripartite tricarboxylate transporter family receptor